MNRKLKKAIILFIEHYKICNDPTEVYAYICVKLDFTDDEAIEFLKHCEEQINVN